MNVIERFQKSFAFNWGVGTIEFGAGKIAELGNIVKSMKANKTLVVTDKGLTETGILEKIKTLPALGAFDENDLKELLRISKIATYQPDDLIAVEGDDGELRIILLSQCEDFFKEINGLYTLTTCFRHVCQQYRSPV